jgi:phage/plasmid-associated DNA primase
MADLKYEIYSVCDYSKATQKFIDENAIIFYNIEDLSNELENKDNYYHFRVQKNKKYIFFGDLDNYLKNDIDYFNHLLIKFLDNYYNLIINTNDIKYTINNNKKGYYHYSIPKIYGSLNKLKEVHNNILKIFPDEFVFKGNKKIEKNIDTTIYSEHWYRCPNQSKGNINDNNNKHIIKFGTMNDFIIYYIPEESICIDEFIFNDIHNKEIIKNTKNVELIKKINNNEIEIYNKDIFSNILSKTNLYKKLFDECYKKERFELYEYWISVGMAIKNTFLNEDEAFDLFNYYSSKGSNYEGIESTKYKYASFIKKNINAGYTIATIHFYAIEDNKSKFIEIMSKNTLELGQTDICKYLKIIAGHKFIYKYQGELLKLYCYNDKYWEKNDIILRNYLSNQIYDFLKMILTEVYWDNKNFMLLKSKIEKLKSISFKKEIIETYKEYGLDEKINFDEKWYLFGFNNIVYDLEKEEFRDYKYDDYISITCGYDWREPTQDEINTVNSLIISIMPIEEERDTLLQILSTTLEGRCLEKFIIFNGGGGNGKGLINDLLLNMLGNYGMIGNNSILFEKNKTGSNPEKANIHKKRYVVFREPPEKNKFENSVIKELTGGGIFSARSHHEKSCDKELNLTMVVECNKRPLFSEEPKESETRRIIDIYFRSTFVSDNSFLDPNKFIYKSNSEYKTKEFQNKHRFAFFKILTNIHSIYKNNKYTLYIADTIKSRTNSYLELSCNILQWFKDNYRLTDDKSDFIKIKDVYDKFSNSDYMYNLSKTDKNKYNKKYFNEYFESNIFFNKYYADRYNDLRNVIRCWKIKNELDDDDF